MAGRWIMFAIVMAWRFARAYPLVIVALIAVYLVGAGVVTLAQASGLGNNLYLLVAAAVVGLVLAAGMWGQRPKARAQRREKKAMYADQSKKVTDRRTLYLAWELGTIEPAAAVAEIRARNPSGSDMASTTQEKRILREAEEALATGTTAARDDRLRLLASNGNEWASRCPTQSLMNSTTRCSIPSITRSDFRAIPAQIGGPRLRRRHRGRTRPRPGRRADDEFPISVE